MNYYILLDRTQTLELMGSIKIANTLDGGGDVVGWFGNRSGCETEGVTNASSSWVTNYVAQDQPQDIRDVSSSS